MESAYSDKIQLSRQGHGQRKKSDLKFSWDERDRAKISEDWSLQKARDQIADEMNVRLTLFSGDY